uniref:uncharacterized protein LOC122604790 n=1 Tax=Erigeron canadensis TaxID=72917 RepID=UPI001CB89727|nr:uncharacterized protein LOC122604790 [Erigeron canadensis]
MAHLAKEAKAHNNNQANKPSGSVNTRFPQLEWNQKNNEDAKPKNEKHMIQHTCANVALSTIKVPNITFSSDDPIPEHCTGEEPLIIKAIVGTTQIHRIYVDGGSSAEIMYEHCFEQLTTEEKAIMLPPTAPLVGFSGQVSWPLGTISLPVTLYDYRGRMSKTIITDFMIIRAPSPYNIILGRPGMRQLGAVASPLHSIMKFTTKHGIAIIIGERLQQPTCNQISRKRDHPDSSNDTQDVEKIVINESYPEQKVSIAANLPRTLKQHLCEFLSSNKDVFAWTPSDMTGVPRELAEHKLNVHPRTFPVWQKKRVLAKERSNAITTKVKKLVEARILRAIFFPKWVSNPVMVKNIDGTWRMCIDFTNLNKACPKDSYLLPEIDQKIESLEGYKLKCFLDAYKGYHQIRMAKEDEEKTSFHTEHGTFL